MSRRYARAAAVTGVSRQSRHGYRVENNKIESSLNQCRAPADATFRFCFVVVFCPAAVVGRNKPRARARARPLSPRGLRESGRRAYLLNTR